MRLTYVEITDAAARAIEMLTIKSHTGPLEDNWQWWEQARGAVQFWEELVGPEAKSADRERLQFLLDDMPGVGDEGEGNWHLTPIVRI